MREVVASARSLAGSKAHEAERESARTRQLREASRAADGKSVAASGFRAPFYMLFSKSTEAKLGLI